MLFRSHIVSIVSGILLLVFIVSSLACPYDYCSTVEYNFRDDDTCSNDSEDCCYNDTFQSDCAEFQGRLWLLLLFITIITCVSISRCCFACNPCVEDPPVVKYVKEQRQYSANLESIRKGKLSTRSVDTKEGIDPDL